MRYYIYDWYGTNIPSNFPEAKLEKLTRFDNEGTRKNPVTVPREVECYTLEIEDIHKFVLAWGKTIQLVPPKIDFPYWSIYVSCDGRWSQR